MCVSVLSNSLTKDSILCPDECFVTMLLSGVGPSGEVLGNLGEPPGVSGKIREH